MSTSVLSPRIRIKAVYSHLDCLLTGIDRLKAAKIKNFEVLAPLPRHEIEEIIYEGEPSPVRWWTLTGALSGLVGGFLLASLTHSQWPMINPGGKPVVSLPAFAVVMFECTILIGALCTLLGMIFHSRLPAISLDKALQDPRVTDDQFIIVFTGALVSEQEKIMEILQSTDPVEITTGDDTIYEVANA